MKSGRKEDFLKKKKKIEIKMLIIYVYSNSFDFFSLYYLRIKKFRNFDNILFYFIFYIVKIKYEKINFLIIFMFKRSLSKTILQKSNIRSLNPLT